MAPKSEYRNLIVQLVGDRTETIPVASDYALPLVGRDDHFIYIQAADGSEVAFRASDLLTLHLKD